MAEADAILEEAGRALDDERRVAGVEHGDFQDRAQQQQPEHHRVTERETAARRVGVGAARAAERVEGHRRALG